MYLFLFFFDCCTVLSLILHVRLKRAPGRLAQDAYNRGSEQNLTAISVFFRFPKRGARAFPEPRPAPPAPRPAPAEPPLKAPKVEQRPKMARAVTQDDLREIKAARREKRESQNEAPQNEHLFIYVQNEEKGERHLLEAAGHTRGPSSSCGYAGCPNPANSCVRQHLLWNVAILCGLASKR